MARGPGGSVTFYLVGLVFAILTAMGVLGVAYKLNQDLVVAEEQTAKFKRQFEDEHAEVDRLNRELKDARTLVHGKPDEIVKYEYFETAIHSPANERLQQILSQEYISTDDWKNITNPEIKALWEKLSNYKGKTDRYTNLAELFDEIYDQLTAVIHIIPRLRSERFLARAELDKQRERAVTDLNAKQREIDDLRREKNDLQDANIELARKFDVEKQRLQKEKEDVVKERGRLERDFNLEQARVLSQNSQLQARIDDLTKKQAKSFATDSSSDGEVVYADAGLGYAWINLGRRNGLRRNTRFQAFHFVKGGLQKIKGDIEVRRVDEDMAQCAIIENLEIIHPITGELLHLPDANDPIVKGDLIRNPFFDDQEQKVFVFLGTKLQNRYYNLQEIQRKIEEFGARVDRDVSIESDFVIVLGKEDEDAEMQEKVRKAAQFGVIFMREDELLEYLGR